MLLLSRCVRSWLVFVFLLSRIAQSWLILFFLLSLLSTSLEVAAKSSIQTSFTLSSTCPSKTINYITATLAQQCLRTSWSSERVPGGEKRVEDALSGADATTDAATVITLGMSAESAPITNLVSSAQSSPATEATLTSASSSPSGNNDTVEDSQSSVESDNDPLSDNTNFLSFEDWKAQMLKKAGQSPDHVSGSAVEKQREQNRRQPDGINNALDALGEEGEIAIEFKGFVTPDATTNPLPTQDADARERKDEEGFNVDKPRPHSKDAGTTSKERFNFASFDCAATVLKTNKGCKGATSILLENKDSYMLNTCSTDNKFLIVELCNDILIDTIVLGNFEFFSSTFKNFRVSVSDRYPVKSDKWKEIGTFEARNTRGVQAFLVENGVIWARYLRIEFLSHYGKEYYCPISLLRVHGKTMMDDYRADMKADRGEDNDEDDVEEEPVEKVVAEPLKGSPSDTKPTGPSKSESKVVETLSPNWQDTPLIDKCPRKSHSSPLIQQFELFSSSCARRARFCNMVTVNVIPYKPVATIKERKITTTTALNPSIVHPNAEKPGTSSSGKTKTGVENRDSFMGSSSDESKPNTSTSTSATKAGVTSLSAESPESSVKSSIKSSEAAGPSKTQSEHTASSSNKAPSQGTSAIPATQESFFKSVHKRLQQLESNSTLSLQYIEEQSRILREAFTKVEKRQLSKTSSFLETLNTTVLSELREFRLQYDQIWQSTVLELSSQREQSQKEVTALSQRLTILADEIMWQKRIVYLQFGLILLCLCLVIFPRHPAGSGSFDLQSMVAKPSASFARYLNMESPPGTPSRPGSRYGLFNRKFAHFRGTSQDTLSDDDAVKTPNIEYQLPTPSSENDDRERADSVSSPEADPMIRRAQSTPNLSKESDDLLEASEPDETHPYGSSGDELLH